jgi:hypothetical protein
MKSKQPPQTMVQTIKNNCTTAVHNLTMSYGEKLKKTLKATKQMLCQFQPIKKAQQTQA